MKGLLARCFLGILIGVFVAGAPRFWKTSQTLWAEYQQRSRDAESKHTKRDPSEVRNILYEWVLGSE